MDSQIIRRIRIQQGDLTRLQVEAIVNAANRSLLGGGGVDGAIHAAAGPELLEECRSLGGCPTGQARLTKGYRLPAGHVIHTVGPVWGGGHSGEAELLAACYQNSLQIAAEQAFLTLAFPSISTGAYGYPLPRACRLALSTVITFLESHEFPRRVIFVCFTRGDYELYQQAWAELQAG